MTWVAIIGGTVAWLMLIGVAIYVFFMREVL